jgi:UDP-N-acetylglucosamine 2-epimerase (non-hydrolysing)
MYAMGARPNFVKMAPVVAALRERLPGGSHIVVDTGQHYDHELSSLLIDELGLPEPNHRLGVGSATHAVQTARIMERLEPVIQSERPDLTIVCGDVNSTLAVALTAAKQGVSVAHVEAGLRNFDRQMPEEINRALTDHLSEYLFVHSEEARQNLLDEGLDAQRIHFVGNTMIDSLVRMEPRFRVRGLAAELGLDRGTYLLVTLHRPTLVETARLREAMDRLGELAKELPVLFPAHPRTRKAIGRMTLPKRVRLLPALGYVDFLSLEADAAAVLTDSGGVQEETTYLGVPCFTLRADTERPVTVRAGTNTVLGLEPRRIPDIPLLLAQRDDVPLEAPPGWDGRAAERVASVIAGQIPRTAAPTPPETAGRRSAAYGRTGVPDGVSATLRLPPV